MELTQNVSESHVEGVIAIAKSDGRENGQGPSYGIHAIAAGIYHPRDHHDLQCHGSGAVWAKVNGCRVAGAQVSESEAGNCLVEICRCGHDAVAPRGLPFWLSLQPFPPCAPFCVVFARHSPLHSLPCLNSRAHPPVLRVWVSHLCPCLVCSRMILSLTAQTHCVCVCE
jgi:hypothetical protein